MDLQIPRRDRRGIFVCSARASFDSYGMIIGDILNSEGHTKCLYANIQFDALYHAVSNCLEIAAAISLSEPSSTIQAKRCVNLLSRWPAPVSGSVKETAPVFPALGTLRPVRLLVGWHSNSGACARLNGRPVSTRLYCRGSFLVEPLHSSYLASYCSISFCRAPIWNPFRSLRAGPVVPAQSAPMRLPSLRAMRQPRGPT